MSGREQASYRSVPYICVLCICFFCSSGCNRAVRDSPPYAQTQSPAGGAPVAHGHYTIIAAGVDSSGRQLAVTFRAPSPASMAGMLIVDLKTGRTQEVVRGHFLSWSPDGSAFAYADYRDSRIKVHALADGSISTIDWVSSAVDFKWAPSGDEVAVLAVVPGDPSHDAQLLVATSDGTSRRTLLTWPDISYNSVAWGPSSQYLFFRGLPPEPPGPPAIARIQASGGPPEILFRGDVGYSVAVSQSGEKLCFLRRAASGWEVVSMDLARSEIEAVDAPHGRLEPTSMACSPDGRVVVVPDTSKQLWYLDLDAGDAHVVASNGTLPIWLPRSGEGFLFFSLRQDTIQLYQAKPDGKGVELIWAWPSE